MPKPGSLPEYAIRIITYAALEPYIRAFGGRKLGFLVLIGPAGVAKSRYFQEIVGSDAHWLSGNATPFGIYIDAFENRDIPLVFDDIDGLNRDRIGVRLLKALCQSDRRKRICWCSEARSLERKGIPKQFVTTSPVAFIANEWKTLNADVSALEDRGHLIYFQPGAIEVHRYAAKWFRDQQIFDFIADHLHLFQQNSLRTYVLAQEQKNAGLDWRAFVLGRCVLGKTLEVARLKADGRYKTEKQRVQAFIDAGHGSRASYFAHAKKLKPSEPVPRIILQNPQQSPPCDSAGSIFDVLRKRYGYLGNG